MFNLTAYRAARRAATSLRRHPRALPLDGEIAFADAYAAACKEPAAAPDNAARVLARSLRTAALPRVGSLPPLWGERARCAV